jgi:hypothetical protein
MTLSDDISSMLSEQRAMKKAAKDLAKKVKSSRRKEKKLRKRCSGLSTTDLRMILADREEKERVENESSREPPSS